MAEALGVAAAILQITGMGAKLSITLHRIGVQISTAQNQLAGIARGISLFSLTLKQVGQTLQQHDSVHAPGAIETTQEIIEQGIFLYSQIQTLVDKVQSFQADGRLAPMSLAKKVTFCLQKTKIDCLLGELDSLKMTLSTMLQVLYTGRLMAILKKFEDSGIIPDAELEAKEDEIEQEEDEIRTMVLNRHWSLVRVAQLQSDVYQEELRTSHALDEPTAEKISNSFGKGDSIADVNTDQSIVLFTGNSLSELDQSMSPLSSQPQELMLRSREFAEDLLDKWTVVRRLEIDQYSSTNAEAQGSSSGFEPMIEDNVYQEDEEALEEAQRHPEAYDASQLRKTSNSNYRNPTVEEVSSEIEDGSSESESDTSNSSDSEVEETPSEDKKPKTRPVIRRKALKETAPEICWWRGSDISDFRRTYIDSSLRSVHTIDGKLQRPHEGLLCTNGWTEISNFWVSEEALEVMDYKRTTYVKKFGKEWGYEDWQQKPLTMTVTLHCIHESLTFAEIQKLVDLSAAIRHQRMIRGWPREPLAALAHRQRMMTPFGKMGTIAEGLLKEGKKWQLADAKNVVLEGADVAHQEQGTVGSWSLLAQLLEKRFGDMPPAELMNVTQRLPPPPPPPHPRLPKSRLNSLSSEWEEV